MRKINIPIFVCHQGCPNDCIFCNQKKITGVYNKEKFSEIRENIKSYLDSADSDSEIEIAFFGGSFTGIDFEEQNNYLNVANEFMKDKRVKGIRLSTRPDYIDDKILTNLKEKNVTTIELGVQSMDDNVLLMNKRGLTTDKTYYASKKIKEYGFNLGLQMMVGMYGSDEEKDIYTAQKLIELEPCCVRIYPTVVIRETKLFDLYKSKEYVPYSLKKTIRVCAKLLKMFEEKNIPVIRLGLMASDEIREDNVFGPYHSSMRELVESHIFFEEISEKLKEYMPCKKIIIYCNNKDTSKIIGNHKNNIINLKNKFNLDNIKVVNKKIKENFLIEKES